MLTAADANAIPHTAGDVGRGRYDLNDVCSTGRGGAAELTKKKTKGRESDGEGGPAGGCQ